MLYKLPCGVQAAVSYQRKRQATSYDIVVAGLNSKFSICLLTFISQNGSREALN